MDTAYLIQHPEELDRETLYDLRSLLALYPYYQTARLLLLQNLFLLHDPSFNEELRHAALYISDRRVIFNLVEAAHYHIDGERKDAGDDGRAKGHSLPPESSQKTARKKQGQEQGGQSRTISLIDSFLDSIPQAEEEESEKRKKRKPTVADAAVDYVSYLLATENEDEKRKDDPAPQMKGQDLIDNFINKDGGKIQLKEEPEYKPEIDDTMPAAENEGGDGYFTETLAKIYIKQGRYEKALEIIQRLNLNNPKKNAYFADQMRFLEKLILNSKNNK